MKQLLLLFVLCVLATSAYANLGRSIARCAVVEGDLDRLLCYDKVALQNDLSGPAKKVHNTPLSSKWLVTEDINPIDDSKTVILRLEADTSPSKRGGPVTMVVRCKSNVTELFIDWNDYLGRKAVVTERVGNQEAMRHDWILSTDKGATFYPLSPIKLLKNMMGSKKFVAQTTPYNESPVTAIFDTTGLKDAIKPLREVCNW